MARFRKEGKKEVPEINTGSMSDIIFMFLFFFMVITTMRESDAQVKFTPPKASEYQKLEKKSSVATIYMGEPKKQGIPAIDEVVSIQLNDKFARTRSEDMKVDIKGFIEEERAACAEKDKDPNAITYSLKIDSDVKMRYVNILKQELRQNNALKINYSTKKDKKEGK
ncbi:MAG: biopolymer transporter ExbD [Bacteroidales bacterium]|nr:biopolymer transporter ExbD [Bacteroidales bacterium]